MYEEVHLTNHILLKVTLKHVTASYDKTNVWFEEENV